METRDRQRPPVSPHEHQAANGEDLALGTIAAKTYVEGQRSNRPLSIPIYQAVNFEAPTSEVHRERFRRRASEFYVRFGHPTLRAAAEKIAHLEQAEAGLVFSSGMGAITTTLLALCGGAGRHILAQRQLFGQTYTFLATTLRSLGVEVTFIDADELPRASTALRDNTSLVYIESPSNPLLKVIDIQAVARIARSKGIPLVVDSTFASPALQNPITLGATLVIHSATKFLSGHADVICGACVGPTSLVDRIAQMQELLGTVLDPHAAWLLLRGIRTLGLRVLRQADSALAIAEFLRSSAEVSSVVYPYLSGTPQWPVAERQMRGGGGVLCFVPQGGIPAAHAFVNALEMIPIASSLGGVETIVEMPGDLDWSEDELGGELTEAEIPPGLVRLSVGVEDLSDILRDLQRGLDAIAVNSRDGSAVTREGEGPS